MSTHIQRRETWKRRMDKRIKGRRPQKGSVEKKQTKGKKHVEEKYRREGKAESNYPELYPHARRIARIQRICSRELVAPRRTFLSELRDN